MSFSFRDVLRVMCGGVAKERSAFESEKEAFEYVRNLYKETGGVTPELRRTYEFYLKNFDDGCDREPRSPQRQNSPA